MRGVSIALGSALTLVVCSQAFAQTISPQPDPPGRSRQTAAVACGAGQRPSPNGNGAGAGKVKVGDLNTSGKGHACVPRPR